MSSIRELVLIPGTLVGQGFDVSCMISATKVTHRSTGSVAYARLTIQNAPHELPDGGYFVRYKGITTYLKKEDGCWLGAT
jgi:hypothetical protein